MAWYNFWKKKVQSTDATVLQEMQKVKLEIINATDYPPTRFKAYWETFTDRTKEGFYTAEVRFRGIENSSINEIHSIVSDTEAKVHQLVYKLVTEKMPSYARQ